MMEKGNRSNSRSRKRAKPAASRAGADGAGIWLSLATPLTSTRHNGGDDGAEVLKSVRHYWEQLSVNERQQILFLDEPELVKQLYKLNLSLLCVGLMQRHLKTSNRTAADAVATTKKLTTAGGTAKATQSKVAPSTVPVVQEQTVLPAQNRPATDPSEKTYELLEAMEFMDIGTGTPTCRAVRLDKAKCFAHSSFGCAVAGILTVKTELAEDTDRLFTLVGDVLSGFLTSIHVLTETNFNKLFVTESETINTWENYQRLIAMLVEQVTSVFIVC
ncbi:unnamed protein product [Phytophthora lilii]|uniref:Unnamed protein product n=1 Tax=Phytophthora lilii TaxID=2077276 RepID=A0A9W6WLS2_9STRA|nr:unnamed protein product [Phytophthora lilii]